MSGVSDLLYLVRYVIRTTGVRERFQPADADEIESDMLWAAWRQYRKYDPSKGKLSTYIVKSCRPMACGGLSLQRKKSFRRKGKRRQSFVRLFSELSNRFEHDNRAFATVTPPSKLVEDHEGSATEMRRLRIALRHIKPRHAAVIRLRFGLDDGEPRRLKDIGEMLGLTRERIRTIEAEAINALQRHLVPTVAPPAPPVG